MIEINGKTDLLSLDISELEEYLAGLGEPKYRAKQIFTWLHKGASIDEMSNLSKKLRDRISETAIVNLPTIEAKLISKLDGTVKYLFGLSDGNVIESVFMRYKHGNTICISSEVGCPMGCRFCASTIGGLVRRLLPSELLGQVIAAEKDMGERISNIVMMGIGEPLDNYDNVIKFLRLVGDPNGLNIGARHISLSTCGLVDKIDELAKLDLQITLSISLHAADDETRSSIMPVNNKWKIAELLDSCRRYYAVTGRRISFEYTLIAGKNDSPEYARRLSDTLRHGLYQRSQPFPIHVNLIPVNEVAETGFKRSSVDSVKRFADILAKNGINATVRRKLGSDINASCGQLRRASLDEKLKKESVENSVDIS
ncbi:MAG: 23S rRNA (adenine(2503)-C(2))-methyltransferase RlmN [Clostridiales bacterium]|nr:23S rRNA (adenine(2503)-C(2))-methyltransferase RlmN [Clostridiales bacterium]